MSFRGHLLCPHPDAGGSQPRPPTVAWSGEPATYKTLNLGAVPADQRAAVWARIKTERPAQAELIASEPVQALRAAFDADVVVEDFDD